MDTLPLTPLPSENPDESNDYRKVYADGFVDEAVIRSAIARDPYERFAGMPEDMVLSSCEDDYAGWLAFHSLAIPRVSGCGKFISG